MNMTEVVMSGPDGARLTPREGENLADHGGGVRSGAWTFVTVTDCGRSSLAQAGERWLHRQVGREETDHAVGHLRSELCARLTEEFAGDGARRKNCLR
jgi:hypothetical protein